MQFFLSASSAFASFLAFLEYVYVWRHDLEAAWGSYGLGLMEGSVVAAVFALVTYFLGHFVARAIKF